MMRVRRWGRRFGRWLWIMCTALGLVGMLAYGLEAGPGSQAPTERPSQPDRPDRVAVIQVKGGIFQGTAEFVMDAIGRAEEQGYNCLVIELDTPGGGLDSTQDIVKRMLNARVPVVVYVSPKGGHAASAGTFVTMAGHIAAMAPGTRIGAAHPVFLAPSFPGLPGQPKEDDEEKKKKAQQQQDIMMKKVTNDTVSFVVGVAKQRGRNEKWAEKAVRESVSITSDQAVEKNVVDLEAETLTILLEKIDGREIKLDEQTRVVLRTKLASLDRWEMSLKQRLFAFLSSPNIFWLLLLLGIAGIGMEFYHPGAIFPGAMGALCLILAAISSQVLPVSWGGLVLVIIGIGLMIAEVYVTSYGLLGIGGAILMVMGGIFLIDPSSEPHYLDPNLKVDWSVLIPTVVVLGGMFLYIGYYVVRGLRRKIQTGVEGMQGLIGEARSDIDQQQGRVFVRGEHWMAVSQEPIPAGSKVEVLRVEGLVLHVNKKE